MDDFDDGYLFFFFFVHRLDFIENSWPNLCFLFGQRSKKKTENLTIFCFLPLSLSLTRYIIIGLIFLSFTQSIFGFVVVVVALFFIWSLYIRKHDIKKKILQNTQEKKAHRINFQKIIDFHHHHHHQNSRRSWSSSLLFSSSIMIVMINQQQQQQQRMINNLAAFVVCMLTYSLK